MLGASIICSCFMFVLPNRAFRPIRHAKYGLSTRLIGMHTRKVGLKCMPSNLAGMFYRKYCLCYPPTARICTLERINGTA